MNMNIEEFRDYFWNPFKYYKENALSINEGIIENAQIQNHEAQCLILGAVCCNHLLMAGIDYEMISGKLTKVKGKRAYLVNDFIKRAKTYQDAVHNSINEELTTQGHSIETAADDLDNDMPEEEKAYELLWYCLNQLHRFKSNYIRNLRISLKRLRTNDITKGKELFDLCMSGDLGNEFEVDVCE
jgi:hypothetical protein